MLANVPKGLLMILFAVLVLGMAALIVSGICLAVVKAKADNSSYYKKSVISSLVLMGIVAVSWIFNMGWIRFFLTIVSAPLIHAIVFFLVNMFVAGYMGKSRFVVKLNSLFMITYILFYLLYPDGSDTGEMYFFFGLIHSNALSSIANILSTWIFTAHIILIVLQLVAVAKTKDSTKEKQKENSLTDEL